MGCINAKRAAVGIAAREERCVESRYKRVALERGGTGWGNTHRDPDRQGRGIHTQRTQARIERQRLAPEHSASTGVRCMSLEVYDWLSKFSSFAQRRDRAD